MKIKAFKEDKEETFHCKKLGAGKNICVTFMHSIKKKERKATKLFKIQREFDKTVTERGPCLINLHTLTFRKQVHRYMNTSNKLYQTAKN